MRDIADTLASHCDTCTGAIHWIDCPTGGWWAHDIHPADNHDAESLINVEEDEDNDGRLFTVGIKNETQEVSND